MKKTLEQQQQRQAIVVRENTVIDESAERELDYERRADELDLRERIEFLDFRKQWSSYLLTLVIFIVAFNALFLIAIGLGWLKFADEWLVRIIFTGSFIEVLGLAKIVVEFLFTDQKKAK